jgi:hypothetical protein
VFPNNAFEIMHLQISKNTINSTHKIFFSEGEFTQNKYLLKNNGLQWNCVSSKLMGIIANQESQIIVLYAFSLISVILIEKKKIITRTTLKPITHR